MKRRPRKPTPSPRLAAPQPPRPKPPTSTTPPGNQVRFAGAEATVPMLTEPTSTHREAFDLIGVPIPLRLK